MSAHSPAPWRKKVFTDGSFNVVSFGNGFVCQYTSEKADAEERALAEVDGSLIVAAPDLLAACRAALDDDDDQPIQSETRQRLERAIAKAEGI